MTFSHESQWNATSWRGSREETVFCFFSDSAGAAPAAMPLAQTALDVWCGSSARNRVHVSPLALDNALGDKRKSVDFHSCSWVGRCFRWKLHFYVVLLKNIGQRETKYASVRARRQLLINQPRSGLLLMNCSIWFTCECAVSARPRFRVLSTWMWWVTDGVETRSGSIIY